MSEIEKLPSDHHAISSQEKEVMELLFKTTSNEIKKYSSLFNEFKEGLVIVILFLIFTLSFVDECIKKFIPFTIHYPILIYIFKIMMILILFWIFKNSSLLFTKNKELQSL